MNAAIGLADLPQPAKSRWQPLRAGLVDLFFYDYQEFDFRDGRLLLRGNNGTGKSKVLALMLPFLLEGRTAASRVEPDGDPKKKMEWNLLLGKRYTERTGYSWLEFGHQTDNGEPEFFTIGCGLKAVAGRPLTTWFFTTGLRAGRDFSLVDANKRTLSRERLREVLGDGGELFDRAGRYRRKVDETLFQLGEARYQSLLNLLVELRQPQLSRRPDERGLSRALSDSLPPLDRGVLADVAEAFRNLEAEKAELEGLEESRISVNAFAGFYRRYARIVTRRRAGQVRHRHSRYEKISAKLNRARSDSEQLRQNEKACEQRIEDGRHALAAARVRVQTLRESPEMRTAQALNRAERDLRERQQSADRCRDDVDRLDADAARLRQHAKKAADDAVEFYGQLDEATTQIAALATAAGLAAAHTRLIAPLKLPDGPGEDARAILAAAEKTQDREVASRRRQIDHQRALIAQLAQATAEQNQAQIRWQDASGELERHVKRHARADAAVAAAGDTLVAGFRQFSAGLHELQLPEREDIADALAAWTMSLDGANPAAEAVHTAAAAGTQRLARERAGLEEHCAVLTSALADLHAERRRLESGDVLTPAPAPTRDSQARRNRAGAPFWKLLDFKDTVPADTRAAIEAALESSGLLDAWVTPQGSVLDASDLDVALTAGRPLEQGLDRVLQPAVDRNDPQATRIDEAIIQRVLASIGWGATESAAWIAGDGSWRLGHAQGRWTKEAAEYLGHAAREAARRRRLQELADEIARTSSQIAQLEAKLQENDIAMQRLNAERGGLPDDEALRDAHRRVAEAQRRVIEQRRRFEDANTSLASARDKTAGCAQACKQASEDLRLPDDASDLDRVQLALEDYRAEGKRLWPTLRHHRQLCRTRTQTEVELRAARERLHRETQRRDATETALQEAVATCDALRESVGAAVAEVQGKLTAAQARVGELELGMDEMQETRVQLIRRLAAAATWVTQAGEDLQERRALRDDACRRLRELSDYGLLASADPHLATQRKEGEWTADFAVQLARKIARLLELTDDSDGAWQAIQAQLHERISQLQSALSRRGHEASAEQHDDLTIVRVVFRAQECDTEALLRLLQEEVREREELLDARERELLEEHLVNELSHHLQESIQNTEAAVAGMNDELEKRPTSTGMKLRLKWVPLRDGEEWDGHTAPDGLAEARQRLLRQTPDVWSADDRSAVGGFLKKRIDDLRATDTGGTLAEVLDNALDYRQWHRFVVHRWQDGQWRPAYGPASGGERVLVVTIPLFAAASSQYAGASASAPRLVMLDEAFAGVDDDSRAKSLGLLAHFDMDVVMTSEREWGCYAEVPGLAIAQLTRHEDIDAVHVSNWNWNGRRRERATRALPDLESAARLSART